MITNRDLFDLLDIVEQTAFKKAFDSNNKGESFDDFLSKEGLNFYDFILGGFAWDNAEEGFDYWRKLAYENRYVADMVDVYYNKINAQNAEEPIIEEDCKSIKLPKFLAERIADEMLIQGLITSYLIPALTDKKVIFKNQF